MNISRIANILLGPVVTEKAAMAESVGQYVFKVARDANKSEIRQAVEKFFDVKVASVSTVLLKGKTKRFGQTMGKRKDWKKAYVRLQEGHKIDMQGGGE
jgi:large subunit ribosomal protein L23